eukprot:GHVT01013764.1.p1 GENE.GHVT01013764.1~~GHVT01013764.1.p1  ORF type:complete len:153 (+),score=2.21 GHVT01013764.1:1363-1821(+)
MHSVRRDAPQTLAAIGHWANPMRSEIWYMYVSRSTFTLISNGAAGDIDWKDAIASNEMHGGFVYGVVSKEAHADGNLHYHALLKADCRQTFVGNDTFDVNREPPKIRISKSNVAVYKYVTAHYDWKEYLGVYSRQNALSSAAEKYGYACGHS